MYIKGIDLLRAISFLLVFFFHANFFAFGWVGVDIFFLISGFVIFRKYFDKDIEWIDFLRRRFYRLAPVMTFVVTATTLYFKFFVGGYLLNNVLEESLATLIYSNNWLLILKASDYWSVNSLYDPLIHTWSLGVEEQFYLFFPLLAWITNRRSLLYITIVTVGISFLLDLSYYSTFGKVGLFFAGGVISSVRLKVDNYVYHLLAFIGLSISIVILNEVMSLVFAGILLALLNSIDYGGAKVVQLIGKISYSAYLWHVPLLVACRLYFGQLSFSQVIIVLFFTLLLSWLSYHYIENRWRLNKSRKENKRFILWSIAIFIISGIMLVFEDSSAIRYNVQVKKAESITDIRGKSVIVFGDSKARDFVNILVEDGLSDSSWVYIDYKDSVLLNECNRDTEVYVCLDKPDIAPNILSEFPQGYFVRDKSFPILPTRVRLASILGESTANLTGRPLKYPRKMTYNHIDSLGLRYYDPYESLYNNEDVIYTDENGNLLSEDGIHLTKYGAQYISKKFDR